MVVVLVFFFGGGGWGEEEEDKDEEEEEEEWSNGSFYQWLVIETYVPHSVKQTTIQYVIKQYNMYIMYL